MNKKYLNVDINTILFIRYDLCIGRNDGIELSTC